MKKFNNFLFICLLISFFIFALIGCKEEETNPIELSEINVNVTLDDGKYICDITPSDASLKAVMESNDDLNYATLTIDIASNTLNENYTLNINVDNKKVEPLETVVEDNKIRKFILEHILEEATRIDQLTHMNNRNSFENDLRKIPDVCNEMLACVYVDVNGLHELNNVRGHLMGDIMLQYIAENMIKVFGKDYTYRIGGDEFVAFIVDKDEVSIESSINRFVEAVEREEYHVAIGAKNMTKNELDMDMIIRTAETLMYQNKAAFYQDSQRDRRRR